MHISTRPKRKDASIRSVLKRLPNSLTDVRYLTPRYFLSVGTHFHFDHITGMQLWHGLNLPCNNRPSPLSVWEARVIRVWIIRDSGDTTETCWLTNHSQVVSHMANRKWLCEKFQFLLQSVFRSMLPAPESFQPFSYLFSLIKVIIIWSRGVCWI